MKAIQLLIYTTIIAFALGCSNQWRESDNSVSPQDVDSVIGEVDQAQAQSSTVGAVAQALKLKVEPGVSVYFAGYEPGVMTSFGTVANVLSFSNFEFLEQNVQALDFWIRCPFDSVLFKR